MGGPAAFVGREGELSRLARALGGDARLVLVAGDAGVGKTRFAGEGMARAAAAGMVMVRGECLPVAGTLPLLPVAAALGELGGLDGGGLLAAALDAAPQFVRAEVGRLLPGRSRMTSGPVVNLIPHAGIADRVINAPAGPDHDPMLTKCVSSRMTRHDPEP